MPAQATVTVPISIKLENLSSMLCTAIETGAVTYWCSRVEIAQKPTKAVYRSSFAPQENAEDTELRLYDIPFNGGALTFYVFDEDDGTITRHRLGMRKMLKGLEIMATEAPRFFAYLLNGEDDSDSADAFLQCALFGKIIYG